MTGHRGWVWSVAGYCPHPSQPARLASAGADRTVRLWDPLTGRQIGTPLTGHTDQVRAITCATAADGRVLLVSAGHDGTVRLWHPGTGEPVRAIPLGIGVHSLLPQQPSQPSSQRTTGGATITAGLRTGILDLDVASLLFPA